MRGVVTLTQMLLGFVLVSMHEKSLYRSMLEHTGTVSQVIIVVMGQVATTYFLTIFYGMVKAANNQTDAASSTAQSTLRECCMNLQLTRLN